MNFAWVLVSDPSGGRNMVNVGTGTPGQFACNHCGTPWTSAATVASVAPVPARLGWFSVSAPCVVSSSHGE